MHEYKIIISLSSESFERQASPLTREQQLQIGGKGIYEGIEIKGMIQFRVTLLHLINFKFKRILIPFHQNSDSIPITADSVV